MTLARRLHFAIGLDPVAEIAVNPEVEIRPFRCFGAEQISDLIGQLSGCRVSAFIERGGRRHHVPVDVATGSKGGPQVANDGADHFLQIGLRHTVHLEGLTGGDPQAAVAEAVRQLIHGQKQAGGDASGWAAQAQHHLPLLVTTLLAFVSVVLLIAAVELEDLQCIFTEVRLVIGQLRQQRFFEEVAVAFALFSLGQWRTSVHRPIACALGTC